VDLYTEQVLQEDTRRRCVSSPLSKMLRSMRRRTRMRSREEW
jgi:hypothetical protein